MVDAAEYHGPAEDVISRCLDLCQSVGLTVNVCYTALLAVNRASRRAVLTIRIGFLRCGMLMARYVASSTLQSVGVGILPRRLDRYQRAVGRHPDTNPTRLLRAIVYGGTQAYLRNNRASVYHRGWWEFREASPHGYPPAHFDNVHFDCHLYHCFGDGWQQTTLDQMLDCAKTGDGHCPCLEDIPTPGIVSEWSLRLPVWDQSWPVVKDLAALNEEGERYAYRQMGKGQVRQFASNGAGWFFWTFKVDAPTANNGSGEPHWDLRECIKRGWLDPRWWTGGEGDDDDVALLEEEAEEDTGEPNQAVDVVMLDAYGEHDGLGGWSRRSDQHTEH